MLPDPFLVIATQNPIEYEGTYPLPEAQLDRFLFKLNMGYPDHGQELEMVARHDAGMNPHDVRGAGVRPVASAKDLAAGRAEIHAIRVDPAVQAYIVSLCRATRESPSLQLGVSPRHHVVAARGQGMGVAQRPRLRYSRRSEGGGQAVPASPDHGPPGTGVGGHRRRLGARRNPGHGAHAEMSDRLLIAAPIPTARFAALVAATGLALFAWPGRSWTALLAVELVLLAVFVVDAVICTSPRQIGVTRETPESVTLGETSSIAWVVENRGRRTSTVTVTDALWPSLQFGQRRVDATLPGRGRKRVRTELRPIAPWAVPAQRHHRARRRTAPARMPSGDAIGAWCDPGDARVPES